MPVASSIPPTIALDKDFPRPSLFPGFLGRKGSSTESPVGRPVQFRKTRISAKLRGRGARRAKVTISALPWATTGTSGPREGSSTSHRSSSTRSARFPCSRVPRSRYGSAGTQVPPDWKWERSAQGCTTRICNCSSGARNIVAKTDLRAANRSDPAISPDTSGTADTLMDGNLCSHHNRGFTTVIG